MKFTIPFIYEAEVLQEGSDEPRTVSIIDYTDVHVEQHEKDAFELAFSIGELRYLWNGNVFIYGEGDHDSACSMPASDFHRILKDAKFMAPSFEGPYSKPHLLTPYFVLDVDGMNNDRRFIQTLITTQTKDCHTKEDTQYLEWLRDSRKETIDNINKMASTLALIDGKVHKTVCEPCYVVLSFSIPEGMGATGIMHNTILLNTTDGEFRGEEPNSFSANEYEAALECVNKFKTKDSSNNHVRKTTFLKLDQMSASQPPARPTEIFIHKEEAMSSWRPTIH